MKIKDKNSNMINKLYDEMRYNDNTTGEHINVTHGSSNMDKRECGIISILSLMCICGKYEIAENQVKEKTKLNITSRMLDNANNLIDDTFVKDEDENEKWGLGA